MAWVPSFGSRFPQGKSGFTVRLFSHTLEKLECDFSVRDSWAVLTVGDLHMEDDMTLHEQARDDCMNALKKLSIMAVPLGLTAVSRPTNLALPTVVEQLWQKQASELTAAQLELLLTYKREGDKCHSYLVSLGDLGRKE